MIKENEDYVDRPDYDVGFLKVAAAGSAFILAPVFLSLMFSEPQYFGWIFLLWILVPICVIAVPYMLVIPAVITIDNMMVNARHGVWTLKIPLHIVEYTEIVSAPPSWVNNHYMFPNAQWVHFRKTKGLIKSWYVPATSATQLILTVRTMSKKEERE